MIQGDMGAVSAAPTGGEIVSAPTEGTQATNTTEAGKSPLDFAKQFRALSKKEATIHAKESKMAAEMKEFQSYKAARASAKINPMAFLKEAGLTYEDLTNFQLAGGESSPDVQYKNLESKLEAYKREQEENSKRAEETNKSKFVEKYKTEIDSFVKTNKDEYELLSMKPDAKQTIFETIEAYYKQNGRELSFKEAADMCEKYFEETELDSFLKLKKVQSRMAPPKELAYKSEEIRPYARPNTLSNMTHTAEAKPESRALSRDERIEQAARILQRR